MGIVLISYFVITVFIFCVWFKLFIEDTTTAINDRTSWFILLTASIIWPITVPIALLELFLRKHSTKRMDQPSFIPERLQSNRTSTGSGVLPLGYILKQAGLITELQVAAALKAQQTSQSHLRIGEIIAENGWLQQETIDFFAEHLLQIAQLPKKPIGQYLKQAKLLNDAQIDDILEIQKQTSLKFGEVAVQKGWVKPETINFILHCLGSNSTTYQSI